MNENWFVLSEEQQLGPYTGEQLVQFAQEGRISVDTMVWAEGMAEWVAASQVPGLFAQAPVAVAAKPSWAPPGARPAAASVSPYNTPASSMVTAPVGGNYPFFTIKAASFGLWLWTFLGSFLCIALMGVFFTMAGRNAEAAQTDQAAQSQMAIQMILGFVMLGLFFLCMMMSMVFIYMNLYRAWSCLRAGAPRTTPGMAIGMLFIPFYNIYWIFVAIAGLPKDWNRIVASYDDLHTAPRLSETAFLLYSIGALFPPLAFVMIFPVMSQLCKGINFFAYRRNPSASSVLSNAGFGGVRFG
jgi:hypothetical protein